MWPCFFGEFDHRIELFMARFGPNNSGERARKIHIMHILKRVGVSSVSETDRTVQSVTVFNKSGSF